MNAQSMFKKLGYEYMFYDSIIHYFNEFELGEHHKMSVTFDKNSQAYVGLYKFNRKEVGLDITPQIHKAIHQQMKELGWL